MNELVNIEDVELEDLIEKLTLGGFEVEEIIETEVNNQKQITLDVSATANRSDSLSIQGISTEITALLNRSNNISTYLQKSNNFKQKILENSIDLAENQNYSMFSSVIVENLTNLTVPKWLQQKLVNSGIVPANNLLDFQTYVLLETGYPFSFYDLKKIQARVNNSNFKLTVSEAGEDEKFVTIDETKYDLDDSILTIKANQTPIGIAGIIEYPEFSYSEETTSLLIEASIFKAAKIRQQSRNLGLRTDRSTRYEKSLKHTYLIEALYRLISLLRIHNPSLKCKLHTVGKTVDPSLEPIQLRYETICEILGPSGQSSTGKFDYLDLNTVEMYLDRLNFKFTYDPTHKIWQVEIPHSRTDDITREIDLIEEIGRLHGFNNFLITLPKLKTVGIEDSSYQTRKKVTSSLLNLGFHELIHYSLVNEKTFIENEIKLVNPLVSEYASLRISLLPNLIKTVQENLKQGNAIINGFEYGHDFVSNQPNQFHEKEYVAGIFGGFKTKLNWSEPETTLTWFEAKGKVEQLFKQLNISVEWKKSSKNVTSDLSHPYRNAELYLENEQKLGMFGQIHPILANQLNLAPEIYFFEFDLEMIQQALQRNRLTSYQDYSSYPKIVKDISFIIQQDIPFSEIQKIVHYNGTKFLSSINLLDEYKGASIPDQHTSLCLQLTFQSNEKTLQNKEIEEILKNIRTILTSTFNATIRD